MKSKSIRINRQYKDRLFRLLFGSYEMRENIISLYNALNGTEYPSDKELNGQLLCTTLIRGKMMSCWIGVRL